MARKQALRRLEPVAPYPADASRVTINVLAQASSPDELTSRPRTAGAEPAARRRAEARSGSRRHGRLRKFAVVLHARDDQAQQAEPELRILKIELLEMIVADPSRVDIGLASHRHGSRAARREQADLTDQGGVAERLVDFDELD